MFRTCGRDDIQGATVGSYIPKNNKGAKVAILHDKSPYGKGVADETKKAINAGGLKEAITRAYNDTDKGLHRAHQQDEAGQDRHHRARRLPHRGGADDQAGARAGPGGQDDGLRPLETAEFAQPRRRCYRRRADVVPAQGRDDPKNAALVKKFRDAKYNPEGYTCSAMPR